MSSKSWDSDPMMRGRPDVVAVEWHKHQPWCPRYIVLLVTLFTLGCNRDGPVRIDAYVTLDGEPLEGAAVTFMRTDGDGRTIAGTTDANGRVELTTFRQGDGILRGDYKVCVIKTLQTFQPAAGSLPSSFEEYSRIAGEWTSPMREGVAAVQTLLPRIYASPQTTPLVCKIPPLDKKIVFELSSEP